MGTRSAQRRVMAGIRGSRFPLSCGSHYARRPGQPGFLPRFGTSPRICRAAFILPGLASRSLLPCGPRHPTGRSMRRRMLDSWQLWNAPDATTGQRFKPACSSIRCVCCKVGKTLHIPESLPNGLVNFQQSGEFSNSDQKIPGMDELAQPKICFNSSGDLGPGITDLTTLERNGN